MSVRCAHAGLFLIGALCLSAATAAPLRFFALGDIPYTASELPGMGRLMERAEAERTPFLIHVGDIKGGSSPCTDESLKDIAAVFRAQRVPVAYTPGDNEWTDCHRANAGGLNPRVRLERVRDIFFRDPTVLRLAALGVTSIGGKGRAASYPEDYSFVRDGVLFLGLHVVGSNNGYRPKDPEAMKEFRRRERYTLELLRAVPKVVRSRGARAVVIFCQADPLFGQDPPRGFVSFRGGLVRLMGEFSGSVLLIHGDTHVFRHDRPLLDPATGRPFARFERAEVPGSPLVGGIWVTVDTESASPFEVKEVYEFELTR